MSKEYWEDKHYSFFSNRECEYFPCHKGVRLYFKEREGNQ